MLLLTLALAGCHIAPIAPVGEPTAPPVLTHTAVPVELPTDNEATAQTPAGTPMEVQAPPPAAAPSLPKDENGILIGSEVFDAPLMLMGRGNGINVRAGAGTDSAIVTVAGLGQLCEATEVVNGWYKVRVYPGMFDGYIRSDFLEPYDAAREFYVRPRTDTVAVTDKNNETVQKRSTLVDVRTYLPDIVYHMVFARPDNYVGRPLYSRDLCLLQKGTAEKLQKAQALFAKDGYTIKIYDAYRPSAVSGILFDFVGDGNYAASAGKSAHNRGIAVDITLVDANGNELEMPTLHPMWGLEDKEKHAMSNRSYAGMTSAAKANMDYMTGIMKRCGFTTISSEWWHFADSNADQYPPLDIPFEKITVVEQERTP